MEASGEASLLVTVDRASGRVRERVDIGRTYVTHIIDAAGDGVRAVVYDRFIDLAALMTDGCRARPAVALLDGRGCVHRVGRDAVEFPSRHAHWLVGARVGTGRLDGLWRHDLRTGLCSVWTPEDAPCVGLNEPVVSPDGYVMVLGQNARDGASRLYVLDGNPRRMELLAVCRLPEAAPPGLHGFYAPP